MDLNVIIDSIVNLFGQMASISISIGSVSFSLLDFEVAVLVGDFILAAISRAWLHSGKDKEE